MPFPIWTIIRELILGIKLVISIPCFMILEYNLPNIFMLLSSWRGLALMITGGRLPGMGRQATPFSY